jgi:Flp pilus assembly protein TadG
MDASAREPVDHRPIIAKPADPLSWPRRRFTRSSGDAGSGIADDRGGQLFDFGERPHRGGDGRMTPTSDTRPAGLRALIAGAARRSREECGQAIVYVVLAIVPLLGMAAFAIDVGHAYFAQRELQSQADAAALASAQGLPDSTAASQLAASYSGSAGAKNQQSNLPGVSTNVSFKCAFASVSCTVPSSVVVSEHAKVDTFFARVVGINSIDVVVKATACLGGWNAAYLISDAASSSCIVQPGPCNLGYPASGGSGRASVTFNESAVLRGSATNPGGTERTIDVFYNDEHALTLGVRSVVVKTSATSSTTTNYSVSPLTSNPSSVLSPAVGTTLASGDQAGNDPSDRPAYPALFITDITTNPNSTTGDWQNFGTAKPPSAVFGTWKSAVRTVDKTKSPALVTVTPDADPAKNNWNLGAGSDPVPAGLANEGYGAEARWNVKDLGLTPGHAYRFEFMVHDGDQNKAGGDAGESCLAAVWPG